MNELYILSRNSKGYFREGNYCYPSETNLIIQGCSIIDGKGASFPKGGSTKPSVPQFVMDMKLVFLELSFDPISRVKRGKLYSLAEGPQPCSLFPSSVGGVFELSSSFGQSSIEAYKFVSYDLTRSFNPRNTFTIFGNSRFETRWRILSIDASVTNEEVLVLQEVNSIGSIPSLNKNTIPNKYFSEIEKEYNSLIAELNSSPESVVDHCRDVTTSLLSAIVGNNVNDDRVDLGRLISKLDNRLKVVKSAAEIVNRFHPRRKPNEKERLDLHELSRSESDFATQCVFQIIREMNWALK
ncbi:hypothetical protein [Halobacteriovorax sp.]|uniref:hypothetical protein n=1 Tax=Halobacteriovorax sp. TaxID=2020862 RepID=UPI003AF23065